MKLPDHFASKFFEAPRSIENAEDYAEAYAIKALEKAVYLTSQKYLRDYFAGKAMRMVALDSVPAATVALELGIPEKDYNYHVHWPLWVANRAYAHADAMLAEAAKEKP